MSINALQGIVLLLGIVQLLLAVAIMFFDPRRATNVVLSIYLFVFAIYSAGVMGMTGTRTTEEAAPWTWLVAVAGLQVGIGLTYLTLHVFRPAWFKRPYVTLPLAILSTAPIVLVLIDGLFHTQLMYVGLDSRYVGGYIELSAYLATPISAFFRVVNLIGLQFIQMIFLIYLLRQPDTRSRRAPLIVLLGLEALGVVSQTVLRPTIGSTAAFLLIQFSLTAGVVLAVTQAGALSTENYARLMRRINPRGRGVSVRLKLLLLLAAMIITSVAVQAWISLDTFVQQDRRNERRRLTQLSNDFGSTVADMERTAASLSAVIADRADVKALFKARDRAGLQQLLTPLFNTLQTDYNLAHLYFESPDGRVFASVNNPGQYGDDVTYRQTVAQALATQTTTTGLEIGPDRLGVRSVAPLLDDGQFIGLLEVGLDLDQDLFDSLRNRTGADYRIWVLRDAASVAGLQPPADAPAAPLDRLFFHASTSRNVPFVAADVLQRVLSTGNSETLAVGDGLGQEWSVLVTPAQIYPDRTIGVIEIISSRTAGLSDLRQNQATVLALAAGLALLALTVMWVSTNINVLNPLRHLAAVARRQLTGDLTARAQLETHDEFNQLGDTLNSLTAQLRDSIDSLETRVEIRTAQLQASAEVGRAAASILDTEELFRTIVNLITERFGFYYAAVFTLDDSQQWAVLREATGEAGRVLKERQHRLETGGQSMVGTAVKTRRARIALDTGAEAVRFANPLLPDTRSEIALPLMVGNRVLGALDVQSAQAAAFDETNAAVLQTMADQIAIAVSNAELFKQTEVTLTNTRNLFAASQAMSTATDIDSLLRTIIDHITPDASRAGITLFGPRDETGQPAYFEFVATWAHADFSAMTQLIRPGTRFTAQQLPVVGSVTLAQPLVVPDASAEDVSPALRTLMHRFGAEAMTALALVAGQNPLGILIVGYRQARTFSTDYIQTLVTLSSQAAIVIQNQRSLAETQATLEKLDLINRRLTGEAWQTYTAPRGGALTIRDAAPGAQGTSTPASLNAPIVVRGEPIGALQLQDIDPDRAWSANDRALLEAVANEIAVAIDNARLLEQTERRAQREQFIAEVSRKMLAASNMQGVIQIAGDELSRALQVGRTEVKIGITADATVSTVAAPDSRSTAQEAAA